MICLVDILRAEGVALGHYKVHLATPGRTSPLEAYLGGHFKEWQEKQNAKNFECETVIGLIRLRDEQWLFAGAYRILGVRGKKPRFRYETELLPGQTDLVGRIMIRFKRRFRNSYIRGDKYGSQLEVTKLLERPYAIESFKGYKEVRLSHQVLRMIIQRQEESWQTALSSVNGIYLIIDDKTGKTYVGSAYGRGGIWQRWRSHLEKGHGSTVELRALLKSKGINYAEHFQYSILEIADPLDKKAQVRERENYWKKVLLSREFGYNRN